MRGIAFFIFSMLWCGQVWAVCTLPDGVEGEIVYNADQKLVQYCDGMRWIGMGWKRSAMRSFGDDGQVQYSQDGLLRGDSDFTWDRADKKLKVQGEIRVDSIAANSCADRVKFTEAMTYTALNSILGEAASNAATAERVELVCGTGWHICNADEVLINGLIFQCRNTQAKWIVGGFSSFSHHRRTLWSGQDATLCPVGRYPAWNADHANAKYRGRVHCENETQSYPVACCKDFD